MWGKSKGAPLKAHADTGTDGEMTAVLVDRGRDRVWAGAWDSDDNFHWINGYGVHAALNWCPVDDCSNERWESKSWLEDGKVTDLALDGDGRLWVGTSRDNTGLVPPEGGIKLHNDDLWSSLTPENSQLTTNHGGFASRCSPFPSTAAPRMPSSSPRTSRRRAGHSLSFVTPPSRSPRSRTA